MEPDDIAKLLVQHGFFKSKAKGNYRKSEETGLFVSVKDGISASDADMEEAEDFNIQADSSPKFSKYTPTGYPTPTKRFKLVLEASKMSMEEVYYWLLNYMRQDSSFHHIDKIMDIFSASEQSAFWGAAQSRLGLQQDRASQYLKGISEMIRTGLFPLVRELRIIDEKLEPRNSWGTALAADVALKGEYVDLVENRGGQIQPGSVYHLAQSVGFTILPDLFFNTHVYKLDDVDKTVDELKFNTNVKQVLRRKLYAFVNWKLKTDKELQSRRLFTLKYLRQHWNTIKMYMNWVKPYLKNIARMQMSPEHSDSPDIIGAFESSVMEIELLAYKETSTSYHPCMLATFHYRTRPEMSFQQDQYAHKGPVHVGRVEVTLRSYGWTKGQIDAYKKFKKAEDKLLLGLVDESVKAAMDALGDDLEKYLWEAGEKEFEEKRKIQEAEAKKKKKSAEKSLSMFDPFLSIFRGFGEIGSLFTAGIGSSKGSKDKPKGNPKDAAKAAAAEMFLMYKNYKKAHGLLSW